MDTMQVFRLAMLSLRARKIARRLVKQYGLSESYRKVTERQHVAPYGETYLLWNMTCDNIASLQTGAITRPL